jgi:uncharacterized protein (DUF1684 family)
MTAAPSDYVRQHESWKADRLAKLVAPDGWLNLTDRIWLKPGTSRFGRAPDNDLVLSIGPDHIGVLIEREGGDVVFEPADGGEAILLKRDDRNSPRFSVGPLLCEITVTNGRNALRVRDTEASRIASFPGLDYFPTDANWRIVADWVRLETPIAMTVDTSQGIPSDIEVTHKAVFTHNGAVHELLATHGTPERPQFVIRDLTSGELTYPGARFLFGEDVTEDTIVLDFNKAYNPPCSFTQHAVCPLAPPQNRLPFAITAGEKKPR